MTDAAPVVLRVVGELPAGRAPTIPVGAGEAIRIMTGAPIPVGADAIVMVEHTERAGDDRVRVVRDAKAGDHVRPAGGDVEAVAILVIDVDDQRVARIDAFGDPGLFTPFGAPTTLAG